MTAAEVQAKRDAGLLIEDSLRMGFGPLPGPSPATESVTGPGPSEETVTTEAEDRPAPVLTDIEGMRAKLKTGVQIITAPQLFPTPTEPVARMTSLAEIQPGHEVPEPSVGTGVLYQAITALEPAARVVAVEIDHRLCDTLRHTLVEACGGYGKHSPQISSLPQVQQSEPYC